MAVAASQPDGAAEGGSMHLQFTMAKPEIVLVEDSMNLNTNALILGVSIASFGFLGSGISSIFTVQIVWASKSHQCRMFQNLLKAYKNELFLGYYLDAVFKTIVLK